MLTRHNRVSLVLAAVLLAGQWLAGSHLTEHSLQVAHDCAVCQFAHGAGAGALPAAPLLVLAAAAEVLVPDVLTPAAAAAAYRQPIRGPPSLLA
jgi:hypothetical protein